MSGALGDTWLLHFTCFVFSAVHCPVAWCLAALRSLCTAANRPGHTAFHRTAPATATHTPRSALPPFSLTSAASLPPRPKSVPLPPSPCASCLPPSGARRDRLQGRTLQTDIKAAGGKRSAAQKHHTGRQCTSCKGAIRLCSASPGRHGGHVRHAASGAHAAESRRHAALPQHRTTAGRETTAAGRAQVNLRLHWLSCRCRLCANL